MGYWSKKVDLGNLLDPDADLTLLERAEGIDKAFAEAGLYDWILYGADLRSRVEQLKEYAKEIPEDPDVFDVSLARVYDWADDQRVWLESCR